MSQAGTAHFLCYNEVMEINLGQLAIPELIVMTVAGVAVLLFGYRIKKAAFFIIWFLIGLNLMNNLMPEINKWVPQIATSELWQNLLPIAGGLLLALLGFSIEKLCVSLLCFALVMLITVQYFGAEIPTLAIGAIVGVIVGAFAVTMMKPAFIIASAAAGAYALTLCILHWFSGISFGVFYFPILIGLAVIGAIFQFATTKHLE